MQHVITDENLDELGDVLWNLRTSRVPQVTQYDVADMIGTKQAVISNFERKITQPRLDTLVRYLNSIGFELVIQEAR